MTKKQALDTARRLSAKNSTTYIAVYDSDYETFRAVEYDSMSTIFYSDAEIVEFFESGRSVD